MASFWDLGGKTDLFHIIMNYIADTTSTPSCPYIGEQKGLNKVKSNPILVG